MQSFIAIHNNTKGPAFTTFDTVQAAKNYLQQLIHSQQVNPTDTLAIIRASDDSIVYFRQQNNTIASLNEAFKQQQAGFALSLHRFYQTTKDQLTLAFTALNNVVSRR